MLDQLAHFDWVFLLLVVTVNAHLFIECFFLFIVAVEGGDNAWVEYKENTSKSEKWSLVTSYREKEGANKWSEKQTNSIGGLNPSNIHLSFCAFETAKNGHT